MVQNINSSNLRPTIGFISYSTDFNNRLLEIKRVTIKNGNKTVSKFYGGLGLLDNSILVITAPKNEIKDGNSDYFIGKKRIQVFKKETIACTDTAVLFTDFKIRDLKESAFERDDITPKLLPRYEDTSNKSIKLKLVYQRKNKEHVLINYGELIKMEGENKLYLMISGNHLVEGCKCNYKMKKNQSYYIGKKEVILSNPRRIQSTNNIVFNIGIKGGC